MSARLASASLMRVGSFSLARDFEVARRDERSAAVFGALDAMISRCSPAGYR
jgi:hypothetical protein